MERDKRERETETERQTDRQTDRQRQTERGKKNEIVIKRRKRARGALVGTKEEMVEEK